MGRQGSHHDAGGHDVRPRWRSVIEVAALASVLLAGALALQSANQGVQAPLSAMYERGIRLNGGLLPNRWSLALTVIAEPSRLRMVGAHPPSDRCLPARVCDWADSCPDRP
jgi:hypothetical protein